MEYCEELLKYIADNQNRNALLLLESLKKDSFPKSYLEAREKILITEAAKCLNKRIPQLYVDEKLLAKDLFEDGVPIENIVERLCSLVRNCAKADRDTALKKAASYIDGNLFNYQLTVGTAAEYAGLSQSEFVKIFRKISGVTPGDYIGEKRSLKSIEYLKENKSVEKAAFLVGFSAVETYIRTFKKHMGITPGTWKKKNL